MGKIALSQNISLDGVIQLDGLMQSPGPADVPFKNTRWAVGFPGFNYEEGQDRAAPGRIASARGRRGEHDLRALTWQLLGGRSCDARRRPPEHPHHVPTEPRGPRRDERHPQPGRSSGRFWANLPSRIPVAWPTSIR
jgi:hypothetical protein